MAVDPIQLHHISGDPDPPATDIFFPKRELLSCSLLNVIRLALAIGLAWAIMFLLLSLIALGTGGSSAVFDLFELLYPGAATGVYATIILGLALSFIYAFLFGLLLGLIYNSLMRRLVSDTETFDMFA